MLKILWPVLQHKNISHLYVCQRFKGHSKWQNIRHIKAAKDAQKSSCNQMYIKKMKIAIAEEGGNQNPESNVRLSKVIEEAKKSGMPLETIRGFLKKLNEQKQKSEYRQLGIKGPNGLYLIIQLYTHNLVNFRMTLNNIVKKFNVTVVDQVPKGMFDHKGIVITNFLKSVEEATDDAIFCDAEDVEEIKESDLKYLQFCCDPKKIFIVKNKLEQNKYEIIKIEEHYIPINVVKLSKEQESTIEKLYEKLETFEEVIDIQTNIE